MLRYTCALLLLLTACRAAPASSPATLNQSLEGELRFEALAPADATVTQHADLRLEATLVAGEHALDLSATLLHLNGTPIGGFATAVLEYRPEGGWLPGQYTWWFSGRDVQGNTVQSAPRSFTVDMQPPVLELLRAPEGCVRSPNVPIELRFSDGSSGVDRTRTLLVVDGVIHDRIPGDAFRYVPPEGWVDGEHCWSASATDFAGNAAVLPEQCFRVDRVGPSIQVDYPEMPLHTSAAQILLLAQADEAIAAVYLEGTTPSFDPGGAISAVLPLSEGAAAPTLLVEDLCGNFGGVMLDIHRDLTGPAITITSPAEGAVLPGSEVVVSADIVDPAPLAALYIGGESISPAASAAATVPLIPGANAISVVALDDAGNRSEATVNVTRSVEQPLELRVTSPVGGQVFASGAVRFAGQVLSSAGGRTLTLDGAPVTLDASGHFDLLQTRPTGAASATLVAADATSAQQQQVVSFQVVADTDPALAGPPGTAATLVAISGLEQVALAGALSPEPLVVKVVDAEGTTISNVAVTFTITSSDGSVVDDQGTDHTSFTVATDVDGLASTHLRAAGEPGVRRTRAQVDFTGNERSPLHFAIHGVQATPGAPTRLRGVVVDQGRRAVAGAVVSHLPSATSATTDARGHFALEGLPAGALQLDVEPPSPSPREYAATTVAARVHAEVENFLAAPVVLVRPSKHSRVTVAADQAFTLTSAEAPGVELDIVANGAVFPGAVTSGEIALTVLPLGDAPVPLPSEHTPGTLLHVHPAEVSFSPHAALRFPNTDGLPAGTQLELMTYYSGSGTWGRAGAAAVSADGTVIETAPGNGAHTGGYFLLAALPPVATTRVVTQLDAPDCSCDVFGRSALSNDITLGFGVELLEVPVLPGATLRCRCWRGGAGGGATADPDGDGSPNVCDDDDDGDGVSPPADSDDLDAAVCGDSDADNCDDCASGSFDPLADGGDFDEDGLCDLGDSNHVEDAEAFIAGRRPEPASDATLCLAIDAPDALLNVTIAGQIAQVGAAGLYCAVVDLSGLPEAVAWAADLAGGGSVGGDVPLDFSGDLLLDACTGAPLGLFVDRDGDGFSVRCDCDDGERLTYPGATEIEDGADNDCDGEIDEPAHDDFCPPVNPDPGGTGEILGSLHVLQWNVNLLDAVLGDDSADCRYPRIVDRLLASDADILVLTELARESDDACGGTEHGGPGVLELGELLADAGYHAALFNKPDGCPSLQGGGQAIFSRFDLRLTGWECWENASVTPGPLEEDFAGKGVLWARLRVDSGELAGQELDVFSVHAQSDSTSYGDRHRVRQGGFDHGTLPSLPVECASLPAPDPGQWRQLTQIANRQYSNGVPQLFAGTFNVDSRSEYDVTNVCAGPAGDPITWSLNEHDGLLNALSFLRPGVWRPARDLWGLTGAGYAAGRTVDHVETDFTPAHGVAEGRFDQLIVRDSYDGSRGISLRFLGEATAMRVLRMEDTAEGLCQTGASGPVRGLPYLSDHYAVDAQLIICDGRCPDPVTAGTGPVLLGTVPGGPEGFLPVFTGEDFVIFEFDELLHEQSPMFLDATSAGLRIRDLDGGFDHEVFATFWQGRLAVVQVSQPFAPGGRRFRVELPAAALRDLDGLPLREDIDFEFLTAAAEQRLPSPVFVEGDAGTPLRDHEHRECPVTSLDADGDCWEDWQTGEDDHDPATYPGAPEICDHIDNDTDGAADEDLECLPKCNRYTGIAGAEAALVVCKEVLSGGHPVGGDAVAPGDQLEIRVSIKSLDSEQFGLMPDTYMVILLDTSDSTADFESERNDIIERLLSHAQTWESLGSEVRVAIVPFSSDIGEAVGLDGLVTPAATPAELMGIPSIPIGGGTDYVRGLNAGLAVLNAAEIRDPGVLKQLVLISDGFVGAGPSAEALSHFTQGIVDRPLPDNYVVHLVRTVPDGVMGVPEFLNNLVEGTGGDSTVGTFEALAGSAPIEVLNPSRPPTDIRVHEIVTPDQVHVVPDSLFLSEGIDLLPPPFDHLFFGEGRGTFDVEDPIDGQVHWLHFSVDVDSCSAQDTLEPNDAESVVELDIYGQEVSLPIPTPSFACGQPGVTVEKNYDPNSQTILLTVRAPLQDAYDVVVEDCPSRHWQYAPEACPNSEGFDCVTGALTDHFLWEIGTLAIGETVELALPVEFIGITDSDEQVPLDADAKLGLADPFGMGCFPEARWAHIPDGPTRRTPVPQLEVPPPAHQLAPADELPPDYFLRPAQDILEFRDDVPESYAFRPESGRWPPPARPAPFAPQDSDFIFVDSAENGFVDTWAPPLLGGTVDNLRFVGGVPRVAGQGDRLALNQDARIVALVYNSGGEMPAGDGTAELYVESAVGSRLIGTRALPPIAPSGFGIVSFDLPVGSLVFDAEVDGYDGVSPSVAGLVRFRVVVTGVPGERHTFNNEATEQVITVGNWRQVLPTTLSEPRSERPVPSDFSPLP